MRSIIQNMAPGYELRNHEFARNLGKPEYDFFNENKKALVKFKKKNF